MFVDIGILYCVEENVSVQVTKMFKSSANKLAVHYILFYFQIDKSIKLSMNVLSCQSRFLQFNTHLETIDENIKYLLTRFALFALSMMMIIVIILLYYV